MYLVDFVPAAARQVADARAWWLENRDKAATALDEDLLRLIERLEQSPHVVGARVAERPSVRRVLLPRVRYHVYFEISGPVVTIIALWHAHRGSSPLS